ncbi:E3 ubiquitin-protein ligase TRIM71-like [Mytilus trossulus]|uniref:E3 ubiquitin-protein ligase TRIM71-like n=1 Tax=Mytilus trossulus TaxID=6551 RepID=UPI00300515BA
MALSHSIAQTPAVCQFCEESPEIKWKCINCELFLCQLCSSKIHSKSKASMEHEIINLKYFEAEDLATSVRKVNLENMLCSKHGKQKCFLYCNECRVPACSKCLMEPHKLHDFKPIDEVYNDIVSEMKDLIIKFESHLKLLRKEKDMQEKILSEGEINFKETRDIILQTEKEMKETISKHAKDILLELEAKWKPNENLMKTELSSMTKDEVETETRKNNLNQILQSHRVADIFSTSKIFDRSLPKFSTTTKKTNEAKFIPGNMHVKLGSQMFGDLYSVPDFEVKHTYQLDDTDLPNTFLFCEDNTAFMGSYSGLTLQKVTFKNRKIKVEREVKIAVFDMAWTKDGEILISSAESDLHLYTKDNKLKTFKSFSPWRTLGVNVTKDNKILVSLVESFFPKPTEDKRLVIMNQDGDIQHTIDYDKDNQRMFTYPGRIKALKDKIVVLDLMNKNSEGRVMMIDYGGLLHWTYNGYNNSNSSQAKFYPSDCAITSADKILVCDLDNHLIHVLNSAGKIIVCKNVKTLELELPFCLSIDNNDLLWIGCLALKDGKKQNAKISCIKLT